MGGKEGKEQELKNWTENDAYEKVQQKNQKLISRWVITEKSVGEAVKIINSIQFNLFS